jgi:hypothetical protein
MVSALVKAATMAQTAQLSITALSNPATMEDYVKNWTTVIFVTAQRAMREIVARMKCPSATTTPVRMEESVTVLEGMTTTANAQLGSLDRIVQEGLSCVI